MATLEPLPMSQNKGDLIQHLDMDLEIYTMMASETDHVYKWLTSDKRHLKSNCKRNPPYDWSDILENSKDEAMRQMASSGNEYTDFYWKLAPKTTDCENWIARWFLYHKFRYRDGRNKKPIERRNGRNANISSSGQSYHHHNNEDVAEELSGDDEYSDSYSRGSQSVDYEVQGYRYAATASTSVHDGYGTGYSAQSAYPALQYASSTAPTYQNGQYNGQARGSDGSGYWDPVRESIGH